MAAAAFVAATDEVVGLGRRPTLDQILDGVERLKAFEVQAAVALFDEYIRHFRSAPDRARSRALKAISAAGDRPEAAELLLRIATAMARAEGAVSAEARTRVDRIARSLGIAAPPETHPEAPAGPEPEAALFEGVEPNIRPTVIVLGNEKGGTGKSTTAMHLIVALAKLHFKLGSIDLDARQSSLSRYIANRREYAEESGEALEMPSHRSVLQSALEMRSEAQTEERNHLRRAFADLANCDFVVVDTPGSDAYLSRLAHEHADTLITPINDSFLDIDVLAQIDRRRREVMAPSHYSQMVWEQNNRRVLSGQPPIDWVVMRNRLSHVEARNKREIAALLIQLSRRIGFRLAPGFGERVVYRELFLKGLTILDLPEAEGSGLPPNSSHLAGRAEIRALLHTIGLDEVAAATVGKASA